MRALAGLDLSRFFTRGLAENRRTFLARARLEVEEDDDGLLLACDPQTSGGLLLSVAPRAAGRLLAGLRKRRAPAAAVVGEVLARTRAREPLLVLRA
jgi:selenide,water dikinase